MRILVVEDQKRLADSLGDIMKKSQYDADVCYDGEQALEYMRMGIYDAAILDVMLPKLNGFDVLKKIREEKNPLPIVLLTAKSETEDKVYGLDCGADYYLTKPFDVNELLASLRAVMRRQGEVVIEELHYGDLTLNLAAYTLYCGNHSIRLGKKEFDVLRLLMANTNMVLSKEMILMKIWGMDSEAVDNNVEIYISFLRKKIGFLKSKVSIITLRQCGYKLEVL